MTSSSNVLDKEISKSWEQGTEVEENRTDILADIYLASVEALIKKVNITGVPRQKNIEVSTNPCANGSECSNKVFNNTISLPNSDPGTVKTAGFKELGNYFPKNNDSGKLNSLIVSATTERNLSGAFEVIIDFELLEPRPPNTKITCVAWDNEKKVWSPHGCKWKGPSHEGRCVCSHLSSFGLLMLGHPSDIPGIKELTYIGLSISVVSLVLSLATEMTVWRAVVKSNTLHVRHTAHVNISVCLLVADCCFLASSKPEGISESWCKASVVMKHFCYLAMFFWMLCLSCMLLYKTVFPFYHVSRTNYLRFSMVLGYVCPMIIVAVTFFSVNEGAQGSYFKRETCWLVYAGPLKGSIFSFIIPIGIIFFVNIFSMVVVIIKILDHPKSIEMSRNNEKKAALTVIRSVVLLTPVFGVTWIFGFALRFVDKASETPSVYVLHYTFTVLNSLQVQ